MEKTDSKSPKVRTPRSPKNKGTPLTDQQYEEIFNSVLHPSQNEVQIFSPSEAEGAELPAEPKAASPRESASVENSQRSQNAQQNTDTTIIATAKDTESISTISTLCSEKIEKNAVCSTPKKKPQPVKRKTFREARESLNKKLNSSTQSELSEILGDSIVDILDMGPFSQHPKTRDRRTRLLWIQERRGVGLWVQCNACNKYRYIDNPDPVDVPKLWFCRLNEDKAFASCETPAKRIPMYMEEDMIYNCYTAGSIVWAKAPGYTWWPAMVDDCPDTEQFYWLEEEKSGFVPTCYHVVFFDDREVTRIWLKVQDLKSYKHNLDLDKSFTVKHKFKKRFNIAKEKARHALTLSIKDRLKQYSFISLWKKDLPDFSDSDITDSEKEPLKKRILKKQKELSQQSEKSSITASQDSDKTLSSKVTNFSQSSNNSVSSSNASKKLKPKNVKSKKEKTRKPLKEKLKKEENPSRKSPRIASQNSNESPKILKENSSVSTSSKASKKTNSQKNESLSKRKTSSPKQLKIKEKKEKEEKVAKSTKTSTPKRKIIHSPKLVLQQLDKEEVKNKKQKMENEANVSNSEKEVKKAKKYFIPPIKKILNSSISSTSSDRTRTEYFN